MEQTGESLLVKGIDPGITLLANSTSKVTLSTSKGIGSILTHIGIPNFILFIIDALIVIYLFLMHYQFQKLPFLFPKQQCNNQCCNNMMHPSDEFKYIFGEL